MSDDFDKHPYTSVHFLQTIVTVVCAVVCAAIAGACVWLALVIVLSLEVA